MSSAEHTFLFCDLVGFTALADAEGDERAATVAAALQRRVKGVAAEHRADVVKCMGDAAMVRCDDPARAVRFALRLVEVVDSDRELPPVRVGIHSGSAVSHEGDWFGRAVNVASRLCHVAAGGEVLVSEATLARATGLRRVAIGERRLHWLKNVTEPVPARIAEGERRFGFAQRLRLTSCPLWPDRSSHATVGGAAS
jgi:class 3 adenylate cyclase